MNLIEKELELAKETEMFVLIPGTELVELSRRNVAKVEAIIAVVSMIFSMLSFMKGC